MGAIAFSKKPEENWVVAGWALRQILDDVASHYPQDSEIAEEFERAKAIKGLMVYLLPPSLAIRVTAAIREVATGILSGTIRSEIADKLYGDERTVRQYIEKRYNNFSKPSHRLSLGTSPPLPSSTPIPRFETISLPPSSKMSKWGWLDTTPDTMRSKLTRTRSPRP
jgi:hypothetical protein